MKTRLAWYDLIKRKSELRQKAHDTLSIGWFVRISIWLGMAGITNLAIISIGIWYESQSPRYILSCAHDTMNVASVQATPPPIVYQSLLAQTVTLSRPLNYLLLYVCTTYIATLIRIMTRLLLISRRGYRSVISTVSYRLIYRIDWLDSPPI